MWVAKIQSLQDLVEKKTNEIALLRTELNSVSSCSFIAQKENEYHVKKFLHVIL
jgi:hypothetical protein